MVRFLGLGRSPGTRMRSSRRRRTAAAQGPPARPAVWRPRCDPDLGRRMRRDHLVTVAVHGCGPELGTGKEGVVHGGSNLPDRRFSVDRVAARRARWGRRRPDEAGRSAARRVVGDFLPVGDPSRCATDREHHGEHVQRDSDSARRMMPGRVDVRIQLAGGEVVVGQSQQVLQWC